MLSTARRCEGRNKRGEPCGATVLRGSAYCWTHDPTKSKERLAARSKGGRARHGRKLAAGQAEGVTIKTAADVLAIVEMAVNDALGLENSVSRSRTLGYLAGVATKVLELAELEERVALLEGSAYANESE